MPTHARFFLCGWLLLSSAARAEDGRASPNGSAGKIAAPAADETFDMSLPPETLAVQPMLPAVHVPPPATPRPDSLPTTAMPPVSGGAHAWAQPTAADNRAPWNRQDPWNSWGSSNRISFFLGIEPFALGGPGANSPGGSQTQTEVGLAYSFGGGFGLRASSIQPLGAWALTFTFMRNRGVRLYDWGDPDIAIGYAMIAPEFGFASDLTLGHTFATAGLSLGGIRTVVGDLLSADVRFTPALWLAPLSVDIPAISFVLGITIDLGLVH